MIRSWLGHAHLYTTYQYAQANLETKRNGLEQADLAAHGGSSDGAKPNWNHNLASNKITQIEGALRLPACGAEFHRDGGGTR